MNMMDNVKYGLLYGALWVLALLPMRMLYVLSDFVAFVIHRVVRYRVDVVRKNLKASFPEKSQKELREIEAKFYHYLCDTFIETIKLIHISEKALRKRIVVTNADVVNNLVEQERPIILFMGHYGNWELMPAQMLSIRCLSVMGALYKPLHNKVMNRLMLRLRGTLGLLCIPDSRAYRMLVDLKGQGKPFMVGFIADQRPLGQQLHHWTEFMGQPTAYMAGGEAIGDRVGALYLYLDIRRTKRGYYELTYCEIEPPIDDNEPFPVTRRFFEMLEATIRRGPAYWLWSHNRWKAKPPVSV